MINRFYIFSMSVLIAVIVALFVYVPFATAQIRDIGIDRPIFDFVNDRYERFGIYQLDSMSVEDCVDFTARYYVQDTYVFTNGELGTYSNGDGFNINVFGIVDYDSIDNTADWGLVELNDSVSIDITDGTTVLNESDASFQSYSYGMPQMWYNSYTEGELWTAYSPLVGNIATAHIYSNDPVCYASTTPVFLSVTGSLFFLTLIELFVLCCFLVVLWFAFRLISWPLRELWSAMKQLMDQ